MQNKIFHIEQVKNLNPSEIKTQILSGDTLLNTSIKDLTEECNL